MASLKDRFPAQFLERLEEFFPQHFAEILRGLTGKRLTTFRINPLKIDRRAFLEEARALGLRLREVPWFDWAFVLLSPTQRELQETHLYREGKIYLQNLSSMLPPLYMELESARSVLDMCAAPGSKTTQICAMLPPGAYLLAVEKVKPRFYRLKANLELQGCREADLLLGDAGVLFRRYAGRFDRVLLDAPCSAEGRFDPHDPRSYAYWSLRKVKEMTRKQRRLLISAYRCMQEGARLVYSTCTFSPEENEWLMEWILNKFPDLRPVDFALPFKNVFPGINGLGWHVIPTETMEGFYICILEKT